jgi:hypothetical protein
MSNKRWVYENTENARNIAVLNTLKDICPAYARHMFDNNRVVEAFVLSTKGGVDPFDMPICKADGCNRPGTRVQDPAFAKQPHQYVKDEFGEEVLVDKMDCYCELHGITHDTKDLRSFLIEDLKIPPEAIMQLEILLYGYGGVT